LSVPQVRHTSRLKHIMVLPLTCRPGIPTFTPTLLSIVEAYLIVSRGCHPSRCLAQFICAPLYRPTPAFLFMASPSYAVLFFFFFNFFSLTLFPVREITLFFFCLVFLPYSACQVTNCTSFWPRDRKDFLFPIVSPSSSLSQPQKRMPFFCAFSLLFLLRRSSLCHGYSACSFFILIKG